MKTRTMPLLHGTPSWFPAFCRHLEVVWQSHCFFCESVLQPENPKHPEARAVGMAHQLRALVVCVSSIHGVAHNCQYLHFLGIWCSLSASVGTWCTHMHADKTPIHTKYFEGKNILTNYKRVSFHRRQRHYQENLLPRNLLILTTETHTPIFQMPKYPHPHYITTCIIFGI